MLQIENCKNWDTKNWESYKNRIIATQRGNDDVTWCCCLGGFALGSCWMETKDFSRIRFGPALESKKLVLVVVFTSFRVAEVECFHATLGWDFKSWDIWNMWSLKQIRLIRCGFTWGQHEFLHRVVWFGTFSHEAGFTCCTQVTWEMARQSKAFGFGCWRLIVKA